MTRLRLPLVALAWMLSALPASAQFFCSPPFLVDVTFAPTLTRWRFCWEMRPTEGLVINQAWYTDRSGVERKVLHRASLAQLHVVYHPGRPRFRDLTLGLPPSVWGMGTLALNLAGAECSPGVLVEPRVCRVVSDRGYAWKSGGSFQRGQEVSVWSSSQLGAYNYIVKWTFKDDGSIEPIVGSTGELQVVDSGAQFLPYGQRVNPEGAATPLVARSHVHNVYYRLDFDISTDVNNAVERLFAYTPHFGPPASPTDACVNWGECGHSVQPGPFPTELYENDWPFMSWRVYNRGVFNADGRTIGYELFPLSRDHWDGRIINDEPWSRGDFYVTTFNGCELLAFDNFPPYIPAGCAGTAQDVLAMVSGQNVNGADVVLWYVTRFTHLPRDEDQPVMPIEYTGFHMQPRSWRHQTTTLP